MTLPAEMLCPGCGYDRRNNYVHDPYAPCPECGDDRCPGVIKKWPPFNVVVWRLMAVQVYTTVGVAAVLTAERAIGFREGLMPCTLVVMYPALLTVCAVMPIVRAEVLAREFCPERERGSKAVSLIALGWLGGLALVGTLCGTTAIVTAI